MYKTVKFVKDFATKKKGDEGVYDPIVANVLVNEQQVAEITGEVKKVQDAPFWEEHQKVIKKRVLEAEAKEAELRAKRDKALAERKRKAGKKRSRSFQQTGGKKR
jgi:ElaB/YqjD/DUF883 family membrane-anchored ribosome-binding protein